MAIYELTAPFNPEDIKKLRIGDLVYVSGKAFTCRSRLHRWVFDEGHESPAAAAERDLLIHVGPIVLRENGNFELVSFMPTSSIRFEKWGARSVDAWDLHMIIGKTTMGGRTMEMMKKKNCVHVSPRGVSPNLWVNSIKISDVELFDELGTIEATWHMELDRLGPFVVDIDTEGNNLFEHIDEIVSENKIKAMELLGIPDDFEYTKLY
ncbi:MAG: L(+)-tartrate dehydratase subunit beta [Clostridiales bacterium]|nr:L(+)-tartrate dehydratase subunit beta [Clostridiales bacterium]